MHALCLFSTKSTLDYNWKRKAHNVVTNYTS